MLLMRQGLKTLNQKKPMTLTDFKTEA